jgi:hypothetical protein
MLTMESVKRLLGFQFVVFKAQVNFQAKMYGQKSLTDSFELQVYETVISIGSHKRSKSH